MDNAEQGKGAESPVIPAFAPPPKPVPLTAPVVTQKPKRGGKKAAQVPAAGSNTEGNPEAEGPVEDEPSRDAVNLAGDRLRGYVDRLERLAEERRALSSDIKDVMTEVKAAGFNTRVVRALLKIRQEDPAELDEFEQLLDAYRHALGMP